MDTTIQLLLGLIASLVGAFIIVSRAHMGRSDRLAEIAEKQQQTLVSLLRESVDLLRESVGQSADFRSEELIAHGALIASDERMVTCQKEMAHDLANCSRTQAQIITNQQRIMEVVERVERKVDKIHGE
jgi:hypothetical protein